MSQRYTQQNILRLCPFIVGGCLAKIYAYKFHHLVCCKSVFIMSSKFVENAGIFLLEINVIESFVHMLITDDLKSLQRFAGYHIYYEEYTYKKGIIIWYVGDGMCITALS